VGRDGAGCFTEEEVSMLAKLYSGPAHAGRSLHPGIVLGAETRGATRSSTGVESTLRGWEPWLMRDGGPSFQRMMVESFLKYLAFEIDDPEFELADFDFAAYPDDMDPLTMQLLDAKETDLRRFRQSGGKMITYFGWSDAAISPLTIVDYYESLNATMDAPPHDFYRLYMVPGMFHCDGGVGADEVDYMTPVIEWVESGSPPKSLIGRHLREGAVQFARPQCPYPQVATYQGSGDVDAAASFRCELPR
jgi:feruloyl esterase